MEQISGFFRIGAIVFCVLGLIQCVRGRGLLFQFDDWIINKATSVAWWIECRINVDTRVMAYDAQRHSFLIYALLVSINAAFYFIEDADATGRIAVVISAVAVNASAFIGALILRERRPSALACMRQRPNPIRLYVRIRTFELIIAILITAFLNPFTAVYMWFLYATDVVMATDSMDPQERQRRWEEVKSRRMDAIPEPT